jgi:hypothetical protein
MTTEKRVSGWTLTIKSRRDLAVKAFIIKNFLEDLQLTFKPKGRAGQSPKSMLKCSRNDVTHG